VTLQADQVLRDREIVELLADDPALLAIADAIHATGPRKRFRWSVAPPVAAAVVALAVVVALTAPWQRASAGIVQRALAAIGDQPVLHVMTERTVPDLWTVDLGTGRETPARSRTEVFFDAGRHLKRTITESPLGRRADELQTATGAWSNGEPVYTCAWIAAHPARAAKARVSCPHGATAGPQLPLLDPALSTFAAGYQQALRSGQAKHVANGRLKGRPVHWLAIGASERVAIDVRTLLPVFVQTTVGGQLSAYRVLSFEAEPFSAAVFVRAKVPAEPQPAGESVHARRETTLAGARRALHGVLIVPAPQAGLTFQSAHVARLLTGYAGKRPFRHSLGVELLYRRAGVKGLVTLQEARSPELVYTHGSSASPPAGQLILRHLRGLEQVPDPKRARLSGLATWQALLHVSGVYVTIDSWSKPLLLEIARTLTKETK
jgi:hypothetical protein